MKKIILVFALFMCSAMYKAADAQVSVHINIGSQPVWGPEGYDYVEYYYFPDIDVYYSVPERQFIYFDGRGWVNDYSLPGMYSNFDLYNSYKVVINDPNPFLRNDYYRSRYMSYRGMYQRQHIIYNSHDSRYFVIENHPEHQRWIESNRRSGYNGGFNNRPEYGRVNNARGYDNRPDYGRQNDARSINNRPEYGRQNDVRGFNNETAANVRRPDYGRQNDTRGFNNAPNATPNNVRRPDNNMNNNNVRSENGRSFDNNRNFGGRHGM